MKKFLSAPFIVFLLAGTLIPMAVIAYYGLTDRTGAFTIENIMAIGTETMPRLSASAFYCLLRQR